MPLLPERLRLQFAADCAALDDVMTSWGGVAVGGGCKVVEVEEGGWGGGFESRRRPVVDAAAAVPLLPELLRSQLAADCAALDDVTETTAAHGKLAFSASASHQPSHPAATAALPLTAAAADPDPDPVDSAVAWLWLQSLGEHCAIVAESCALCAASGNSAFVMPAVSPPSDSAHPMPDTV